MALTKYENNATISTTEYSLPNNANYSSGSPKTDDGILQGYIDVSAMAAGDQYQIRIYEKTESGGTQRVAYQATLLGAQPEPNFVLPALIVAEAWDVTVDKIAGTDRAFRWSIRLAPV